MKRERGRTPVRGRAIARRGLLRALQRDQRALGQAQSNLQRLRIEAMLEICSMSRRLAGRVGDDEDSLRADIA